MTSSGRFNIFTVRFFVVVLFEYCLRSRTTPHNRQTIRGKKNKNNWSEFFILCIILNVVFIIESLRFYFIKHHVGNTRVLFSFFFDFWIFKKDKKKNAALLQANEIYAVTVSSQLARFIAHGLN